MTLHEELKNTIEFLEREGVSKCDINFENLITFLKKLESNISFLLKKNIKKGGDKKTVE